MINLTQLDRTVFVWINRDWSSPILDVLMPFLSRLGGTDAVWLWIAFIGLLMSLMLARRFKNSEELGQRRSLMRALIFFPLYLALIYGVNIGACKSLKQLFHSPRPFVQQAVVLRVSAPSALSLRNNGSFPSGHACNAFMTAVVFSYLFRRKRYVFYGLASLVALSRVYLGVHYPSDVIAGSCLGLALTWLMLFLQPPDIRLAIGSILQS